jgi:hypothetical protein
MTTVLFAGPSIHGLRISDADEFVLSPPAACGDIVRAVRSGANTICLVDGFFAGERAVWHKEILFALSEGVRVLGASSMGALRAAECDRFGMEGVGTIYADYRDGRRTDDADVALLHGPADMSFRPLTLPLVDAEATIAAMESGAAVSRAEARDLVAAARSIHFSRRTWRSVIAASATTRAREEGLHAAAATFRVEQKKADALVLIARLRAPRSVDAAAPAWRLNRTLYLAALERGPS